jgi:hypothetical protein
VPVERLVEPVADLTEAVTAGHHPDPGWYRDGGDVAADVGHPQRRAGGDDVVVRVVVHAADAGGCGGRGHHARAECRQRDENGRTQRPAYPVHRFLLRVEGGRR